MNWQTTQKYFFTDLEWRASQTEGFQWSGWFNWLPTHQERDAASDAIENLIAGLDHYKTARYRAPLVRYMPKNYVWDTWMGKWVWADTPESETAHAFFNPLEGKK